MAMSIAEQARLQRLEELVERLGPAPEPVPVDASRLEAIEARIAVLEERKKPGPKPKVQA